MRIFALRYRARRCAALALLLVAVTTTAAQSAQAKSPLRNVRVVTISSEDPQQSAQRYARELGYRWIEAGTVPEALANLWEAPAVAGRPYVLLQSPDETPSFLRFVQVNTVSEYQPMTATGWNAAEFLVRDPYAIHARLKRGELQHLDGPAPLGSESTIHAAQYLGADREVLYLTADLGERNSSTLARTRNEVGRVFIVVLAGANIDALSTFYNDLFGLSEAFRTAMPIALIARAQGLPVDTKYELALLRLADFSHSIELDAYATANTKPTLAGELPPGIAVVSFCIETFSTAVLERVFRAPRPMPGREYAGREVTALRGPAGELIELIRCDLQAAPDV